jgi:uncharacterized C2H2 Zn-finger protein
MITPSEPETLFGCSSCGRNFSTKSAFTEHVNSPDHPYKCALCKTHYMDIDGFRLHLELTHVGYMCTVGPCPYWAAEELGVEKHIEKHREYQQHIIGSQSLLGVFKARRFGNPLGPGFLRTSKRKKLVEDPGQDAVSAATGTGQPSKKNAGATTSSSHQPLAPSATTGTGTPRTISPKDAILEYHDSDDETDKPLFPQQERLTSFDSRPANAASPTPQPSRTSSFRRYGSSAAAQLSFSSYTGYILDPDRMVCPFRLAIPEEYKDRYASCCTLHKDISSLM